MIKLFLQLKDATARALDLRLGDMGGGASPLLGALHGAVVRQDLHHQSREEDYPYKLPIQAILGSWIRF
jgi:hypothetical protein